MALSLGNRRRGQTSNSWALQHQTSVLAQRTQPGLQKFQVRKQNSFIDSDRAKPSGTNNLLKRGLSVDRSFNSVRQRLVIPSFYQKPPLQRHGLTLQESSLKSSRSFLNGSNSRLYPSASQSTGDSTQPRYTVRARPFVAWSSTSSLLKSHDEELQVAGNLNRPHADVFASKSKRTPASTNGVSHTKSQPAAPSSSKDDVSRINLNIVLAHPSTCREAETLHSDIESSSEHTDNNPVGTITSVEPPARTLASDAGSSEPRSAQSRRAQFTSSRSQAIATGTTTPVSSPIPVTSGNFSASPSLTVQRRPPLIRAMSAPVRSVDENSNSKSVIAASKRKPRRRKLISRNFSCDKSEGSFLEGKAKDLILDDDINGSSKGTLSRTRSTAVADIITLVSLVSSEGSDSEREDNSAKTSGTNSDNSPTRRAPLLRKTGKSVSFQENYPPNFQLASKEYSHMIRRGSIAPLAARLRANRPPTAPPVSIYLSDANTNGTMTSPANERSLNTAVDSSSNEKLSEKPCITESLPTPEYNFPVYVRSIKERECWKLYQKMSNKGVNVSYDTVLRGMLTPTEFRQLQKQRDLEEAKAKELEEMANMLENEKPKPPVSAIERLSESLLKK